MHHAPPAIWKSSIHPLANLHILQVHIDYWLSQDARVKGDLLGICAQIAYFCSAGPLWLVVVLVPFGQHCHAWTTGSYEIIDDPSEYVLINSRVWYPWTFASEPGISGREPFMNRLYNPVALPEPLCRERLVSICNADQSPWADSHCYVHHQGLSDTAWDWAQHLHVLHSGTSNSMTRLVPPSAWHILPLTCLALSSYLWWLLMGRHGDT